jgi:hypothetical protein
MGELAKPPPSLCPVASSELLRSDLLDFDITLDDVKATLDRTSSNKAPGPDGLPYEFYSRYWDELGQIMVDYFSLGLTRGWLDPAATDFTFTFIHKQGRDPHKLGSYRPLAKQNTDYKLISGTVAKHFAKALDALIPGYQTGFLSGRFIGQQTLTVSLALTIMKARGIKGGFLFLDFVNAFNRVDHDFIEKALVQASAPPIFCTYIRALLRNKYFTISLAGNVSKRTPFHFGTAQGDPLSPFLFIFVIDFLSVSMEADGVKPLQLNGDSLTVSQLLHADDTTLAGLPEDLETSLRVSLPRFKNATGSLLAPDKSYLLLQDCSLSPDQHPLLSSIPGPHNRPAELPHRQPFSHKYLGFTFGKDGLVPDFDRLLDRVRSTLERWRKVGLSRHGRFIAMRTYSFSRLYYFLYCLHPNPAQSVRAENLKNWFLYYSTPTFEPGRRYIPAIRANRMALASPLGWGWLGVKERSAALRVWWWTRSIDNDTPWAKLLRFARDNDLLDKSWTCAYENFLKLQILRVEGEGSLLTYSPASDQHDAKTIPTSAARFSHVKEALQLCPKVLTSQLLTDGQRRIYSSPEPLSNLLKLSQSLPLSASIKTW